MKDKHKGAKLDDEREQVKASNTFWKSLRFLDDLPEGPAKEPIPFPYGSSEPRPYGWYSKWPLVQRFEVARQISDMN